MTAGTGSSDSMISSDLMIFLTWSLNESEEGFLTSKESCSELIGMIIGLFNWSGKSLCSDQKSDEELRLFFTSESGEHDELDGLGRKSWVPYCFIAAAANEASLSLYKWAALLLYFCCASLEVQSCSLKNCWALALPPHCMLRSCSHVQFVSNCVDRTKLTCTPNDLCIAEQSIQMKTPKVTLAQEGFFAPQSKHCWKENWHQCWERD